MAGAATVAGVLGRGPRRCQLGLHKPPGAHVCAAVVGGNETSAASARPQKKRRGMEGRPLYQTCPVGRVPSRRLCRRPVSGRASRRAYVFLIDPSVRSHLLYRPGWRKKSKKKLPRRTASPVARASPRRTSGRARRVCQAAIVSCALPLRERTSRPCGARSTGPSPGPARNSAADRPGSCTSA